jgi:DNA topoisomerase-1
MSSNLLIVESPSKCKTIKSYLGKGFEVMASFGHIRELVPKDGSVDTEGDFTAKYQTIERSAQNLKKLTEAVKDAKTLYIATDPDREGESIGWHILEYFKEKRVGLKDKTIHRITFNEITKTAVTEAIKNPRQIDNSLVDAQQSRQFLDYLVGFNLSPVLWRKLPGSKSAGRVQSVALRLVVEREFEIKDFKAQEYWTIDLETKNGIKAELEVFDGVKLDKFAIPNSKRAEQIVAEIEKQDLKIISVDKKKTKRKPYPPFTTSTLQQDASSKLNFGAKKTMLLAQKLYEAGHITYMRTDSPSISEDGLKKIRASVNDIFGKEYLSKSVIQYSSKSKNSQEAHEAIRPTNPSNAPAAINLDSDEVRLYELIWKRALASQASEAEFDSVKITIADDWGNTSFGATGSVMSFDGFLKIYDYNESADKLLPNVKQGDKIEAKSITPVQHFTQPPARYNEASLVKKLEELGIGRPSTYASIVSVIQERGYTELNNKRFFATKKGEVVTEFLKTFFPKYVEYSFTAKLEDELDEISSGGLAKLKFLRSFWKDFKSNVDNIQAKKMQEIVEGIKDRLEYILLEKNEDGTYKKTCPKCSKELDVRIGKFGPFASCSGYPECSYIAKANGDEEEQGDQASGGEVNPDNIIGNIEGYGDVQLKQGPYGLYLEYKDDKGKVKRASVPKDKKREDVNLELAAKILSLPRLVGIHPETKKEIKASIGPYGPYLAYNSKFYNIPKSDTQDLVYTIGINHAVEIIAKKDAMPPKEGSRFKKKSEK